MSWPTFSVAQAWQGWQAVSMSGTPEVCVRVEGERVARGARYCKLCPGEPIFGIPQAGYGEAKRKAQAPAAGWR